MKKWFTGLIFGMVVVLLVIGGACENSNKYYNQALTYYNQERWTEAITEFDRATEINPNEGIYYWYLGECYRQLENYDNSVANYSKAIELYPNSRLMEQVQLPLAYLWRGSCYFDQGQTSLAIQDTTKAIEVDAKDDRKVTSILYCFRGFYYQMLDLRSLAVDDYNTVVKLGDPEWTQRAQEALNNIESSGKR
jgi:tetratricopeptide (TPR) repeat protein